MATKPPACEACHKSSLSLLLLRPSPVANDPALAITGAEKVVPPAPLFQGVTPARAPTQSRYALRLLREGYVHVFIPTPPEGVKPWKVFRVTPQADLAPEGGPWFKAAGKPITCSTTGHNPFGLKILTLPKGLPKNSSIWIAYSANLWNNDLRKKNAANPLAMQEISLAGVSSNTFTPTEENLKTSVLECALSSLKINKATDHDFPFNPIADTAKLAKNLIDAAATNPDTKGKELAVVLRDPVGIATELNALRLQRYDLLEQFCAEPANQHPVKVNQVINLLRNNLIAKVDEDAMSRFAPLKAKKDYVPSAYPAGTEWQEISQEDRATLLKSAPDGWFVDVFSFGAAPILRHQLRNARDLGRLIYPDSDAQAEAWAQAQSTKDWAKMHEFYNEGSRAAWESQFEKKVQTLHLDAVKHYENDWDAALSDEALHNYFARHFDELACYFATDIARIGCCPGSTYIREVARAFTPEPKTEAAQKTFEAQLDADVSKPDAVLLRAMVGNQKSLWEILESDKRDKTYDFIKGLIGEFVAHKTGDNKPPLPANITKRLSWLTDINMGFSLGIVGVASAVSMRGITAYWQKVSAQKPAILPKIDASVLARLKRAEAMTLIHRATEEALLAKGGAVKVPVLLTANISVETLVQIKRARGEMLSMRQIRGLARKGQVSLGILTDTDTLAQLRSVPPEKLTQELAANKSHGIKINEETMRLKSAVLSHGASAGTMLTLPVARFLPLYERQLAEAAKAPALFKTWIAELAQRAKTAKLTTDVRSSYLSLDGRLAVGSMIVQGLGAWGGIQSYLAADNSDKRIDSLLSIADGVAGFLGGAAEFGAKYAEVRLGEELAEKSMGLLFPRAVASGMGAAGGIVNAWMCFRAAAQLKKDGHAALAAGMNRGAYLFIAGGAPLALQFAHQLTLLAIRRGLASGAVMFAEQQLGKIIAVRLGTAAIGLTVPGIGWLLTIVAVGQTIYVIMNTPTPAQTWLKNCYFGIPDSGAKVRGSWEEEDAAWKALQKESAAA